MDQNTKELAWNLAKIGLVGTAVGIPVGIWAMRRWNRPDETWKTALLLTAVGFGVKELMLPSARLQPEAEEAAEESVAGLPVYRNPSYCPYGGPRRRRGRWGGPRRGRGMGTYMPAPGMPPAPSVYYPNLRQKANGRATLRSGRNPTAL